MTRPALAQLTLSGLDLELLAKGTRDLSNATLPLAERLVLCSRTLQNGPEASEHLRSVAPPWR